MHRNQRPRNKSAFKRSDTWYGYAFIAPVLLFVVIFVLVPLVTTVWYGFTNYDLVHPERGIRFIGLENYKYLIENGILQSRLGHSLTITFGSVSIQMVIGMVIALLLDRQFFGRGIARAAFIVPWALPTVAAAFVFRWLFDSQFGTVNEILKMLGVIREGIPWFGEPGLAVLGTIVTHIWKGLAYPVLVLLAGLQMIPQDVKDAVRVDGASAWQEFWLVTLPQLKDVIAICVVLRTVWFFNWFDLVYLMTNGGPGTATMTLPVQVYIMAFRTFKMGQASALATTMVVILLLFAIIFLRLVLGRQNEQGI